MNWEIATAIAEMAGAGAVLVTLVYLAVEVRRNRKAIESASIGALSAGFNNLNTHLMDDPDLLQMFFKGLADPGCLDELQAMRFQITGQSLYKSLHDGG